MVVDNEDRVPETVEVSENKPVSPPNAEPVMNFTQAKIARESRPARSFGNKVILVLVTLATLIGGLAASVQLYDYVTREKKQDTNIGSDSSNGWVSGELQQVERTMVGSHFSMIVPPNWTVADRTTFESSMRMTGNNFDQLLSGTNAPIDIQFLMPKVGTPDDEAGLATQLFLLPKSENGSIEAMLSELEDIRNGPKNGFMDSNGRVRIEAHEKIEGEECPVLRVVLSIGEENDPGHVVSIANLFYAYSVENVWCAMTFCRPGYEIQSSETILAMAKSIQVVGG